MFGTFFAYNERLHKFYYARTTVIGKNGEHIPQKTYIGLVSNLGVLLQPWYTGPEAFALPLLLWVYVCVNLTSLH